MDWCVVGWVFSLCIDWLVGQLILVDTAPFCEKGAEPG